MSGAIASGTISALDLAALLCSRVCHDLISPVGAMVNGIEALEEEKDEEIRAFAFDLIKKSARQASARLQFYRLAFGAAGPAGAEIELGDAEQVARGLLEDGKTKIVWNLPPGLLSKSRVKLLLNMLIVAASAIPRGGMLSVDPIQDSCGFRIAASGLNARLTPATTELLAGSMSRTVDARDIQSFYTGILARECGLAVLATAESEGIVIAAS